MLVRNKMPTCLQRDSMRKGNFCRIGMPGNMKNQLTPYTANFGDAFQITIQ